MKIYLWQRGNCRVEMQEMLERNINIEKENKYFVFF